MFALATMGELDFHYLQYHPIVMPQGSTGLLINASRLPYGGPRRDAACCMHARFLHSPPVGYS